MSINRVGKLISQKPQSKFKIPVDNSEEIFVPRIKTKPNALVALDVAPVYSNKGNIKQPSKHPYQYEIEVFGPTERQSMKYEPIKPRPLNETPLKFIDTSEALQELVQELKNQTEIAVDIEENCWRSFLGLTCILQISTRMSDFIIDCLELREQLHILNEVFTDPKIVKVFHDASCDVPSLQRCLSLYIVNLFDTLRAAQQLKMKELPLKGLAKHYCNVSLNKSIRMSDWRQRPLSEQQIKYAREDTHYLLYIYDNLLNDLIECGQFMCVFNACKDTALLIYQKSPRMDAKTLLKRYGKSLNDRQITILYEIVNWRENIARQNDESRNFVLQNNMILEIVEKLPRNETELYKCWTNGNVPYLVRKFNLQLLNILKK